MRLIAGLGNPGRRYRNTPHNIGFEVVNLLAERHAMKWRQARKIDAEFTDGQIAGVHVALLKPTTYMNSSGNAVAPLVRGEYLKIDRDLLVVYDDVELPAGRLRLRPSGSSAGHNGMRSVIERLGTRDFARLRCGVGPEDRESIHDLAEYVLARWPRSMLDEVSDMASRAADAAEDWLHMPINEVMSRTNARS
ncbi:MAG: aminoacyl-tRNA hydrolase [Candidatus Sumerlaeota bacterium]